MTRVDHPRGTPADHHPLAPLGWDETWVERFAPHDTAGLLPGRVVRHDGSALLVAGSDGTLQLPLSPELQPAPVVGDWVAYDSTTVRGVLPRTSLLRRAEAGGEGEHPLVANVDVVLVVCGADRPTPAGRFHRFAALAADAGAEPVLVLTKADRTDAPGDLVDALVAERPGTRALVTSARTGVGIEELRAVVAGRTVVAVGESGAGKSTLVNTLAGEEVAATAEVRSSDRKGRHTTTARELHVLPAGGCLVDTPGVRSIGLWIDPYAVTEAFPDLEELALRCRFADCRHEAEPGCAVLAAVDAGALSGPRVEAWRALHDEALAAEEAAEQARRRSRGHPRHRR